VPSQTAYGGWQGRTRREHRAQVLARLVRAAFVATTSTTRSTRRSASQWSQTPACYGRPPAPAMRSIRFAVRMWVTACEQW